MMRFNKGEMSGQFVGKEKTLLLELNFEGECW